MRNIAINVHFATVGGNGSSLVQVRTRVAVMFMWVC